MPIIKKIYLMLFSLSFVVILFSYISWLLGYEGFLLQGNLIWTSLFIKATEFVLFALNFFLTSSIILNMYDNKITKFLFLYLVIYVIQMLLMSPSFVGSFILPFSYILAIAVYNNTFTSCFKRFAKLSLFMLIYQGFMLIMKTGVLTIGYNVMPIYQELMFSIDLIILLTILYSVGGEIYVGSKSLVFPENVNSPQFDIEDVEALDRFKGLSGLGKLKASSILLGFQIIQWTLILFVCKIGNVFFEGLVITISFIVFGVVIKRRWHARSVIVCTLTSTILFYVCARAVPSFSTTQLFPIIVGLLVVYSLYRVALYTDKHTPAIDSVKELDKFKLEKYCDYETMKKIAVLKGLTVKEIELIEFKYCRSCSWAAMEAKFSPWSLSSIKRYLKMAENKLCS